MGRNGFEVTVTHHGVWTVLKPSADLPEDECVAIPSVQESHYPIASKIAVM